MYLGKRNHQYNLCFRMFFVKLFYGFFIFTVEGRISGIYIIRSMFNNNNVCIEIFCFSARGKFINGIAQIIKASHLNNAGTAVTRIIRNIFQFRRTVPCKAVRRTCSGRSQRHIQSAYSLGNAVSIKSNHRILGQNC